MSLIQNIRDKYARWAVVAIALALLGFILMDAFSGRGGPDQDTTIGEVNGTDIEFASFSKKVEAEEAARAQQGYGADEASRQQAIQSVWSQEVNSRLLQTQYDKLGMVVSDKELRDILYGSNPPQELAQNFTDPATGQYNAIQAQKYISEVRSKGTSEEKTQMSNYMVALENSRLEQKYTALLSNTIHFPKWYLERRNADNSLIAKISYVTIPFTSIPDSSIKVSDDEIREYMNARKDQFKQEEESRAISYVTFSAAPSAADSAAARAVVLELKPAFDTVTNYEAFVSRNSTLPFYNGFITRGVMQQPNKDSILNTPVGSIYGPYIDAAQGGSQYVMSKVIETRPMADTATVRHILIATMQRSQDGAMMRVKEDSVAKRLVDSIQTAHRGGANFDSLVVKYSEDPGSREKGGRYEDITPARMVGTFNDFVFTNKVGQTGVVKTEYGYHYIEILSQKGSSQGYKVAFIGKPLETSAETETAALSAATQFAGNSRDEKSFNENWEKNLRTQGINRLTASEIRGMDFSIQGMAGASRKFIKDIFAADRGDVVGPEKVGDAYVVGTVTAINEEGLIPVATARPMVEPAIRNKKKAEQIRNNIGAITTLEAVAQKTGQQITTLDSVRFSGANGALGYEPKVLGAAFNPANKGKVITETIAGQLGVYVVRVDATSTIPVEAVNIEAQRQQLVQQYQQGMMQQMQYGGGNPFVESLRKSAEIKDNRASFF